MSEQVNVMLDIIGHIRMLNNEIKALVLMLPKEKQDAWFQVYLQMCGEDGIDHETGKRK